MIAVEVRKLVRTVATVVEMIIRPAGEVYPETRYPGCPQNDQKTHNNSKQPEIPQNDQKCTKITQTFIIVDVFGRSKQHLPASDKRIPVTCLKHMIVGKQCFPYVFSCEMLKIDETCLKPG